MDEIDLGKPNVIPIGGYHYPPPPEWRTVDEVKHQTDLANHVLGPDDVTLQGFPRCTARNKQGVRCGNRVVQGSHVCRFHGAGGRPTHEDDLVSAHQNGAGRARTERIEAIRLHLELTASSAVLAVQSVLEDEMAKPSDRLKAAEIVLDRTVGRQLQLEKEDLEERDLDEEIFALTEALDRTGTDDAPPP